jgi:hypothetical protein
MFNRLFLITLLIITATFSQSASSKQQSAHKLKNAFTIVLFNERTHNLEVMHRFYLHDAEEAVWEVIDKKADIIGSEDTQEKFAQYVIKRFGLKDQAGQDIKLDLVGFQNDGGYFWVYQEVKQPVGLTQLQIRNSALRDIWDEQFNVVNIEAFGQVITLSFSGSDTWLSTDLAN